MTTVHAQFVGDQVVLPRAELDRLIEIARRSEVVELASSDDDLPTWALQQLAEKGGAFDWLGDEEDLYSVNDLRVR